MSTTLPDGGTDGCLQPVVFADLLAYFHQGTKPPADWRVGAEFEKFAVERATGRALAYDEPGGVRDILQALVDRYGWEPHYRGERLTLLSRRGAAVSLEPGGQVEFSSPPVRHLGELSAELHRHRDEVRAVIDPARVAWVAAGVTPFAREEDIPPPVRRRHALMAEYPPARGPMAAHMMKATASTQAAFDYAGEEDAGRKFADALAAAEAVARHFRPADLPGVFESASRHGLAAEHGGHTFLAWAGELAGIAAGGLRRQAERSGRPDERPFLDPVFEVLDRGTSPGSETLAAFAGRPPTPAETLSRYEY